jgi:hypothetical protein
LGPHCWIDPKGKKHYKLSTLIIKEMIKYVDGDNTLRTLRTHDDVPEYIREMIYAEDRHKLDRKRKATTPPPAGLTPVSIHNHLSEHSRILGPAEAKDSDPTPANRMLQFSIYGLRDVSVRRYVCWQQTRVEDERLKAEFQKMGQEILKRNYDLETIFEERDLGFLKEKVEPGTIIRFIRDIPTWAGLQNQDESLVSM